MEFQPPSSRSRQADADSSPPSLSRAVTLRLTLVFLTVEAAYHACGITFDTTHLGTTWQFLDPALLRTDLLRSLWYLHSQPPLFNLFLGIVLKVSGAHWASVLHMLYVGFGLVLYVGLVRLMLELGVGLRVSIVSATVFLLSPSFVLVEHWLFYTFPLTTLLVTTALSIATLVRRPSRLRALIAASLLAVLCGVQSTFQIPYFILVVAGLAILCPRTRIPLAVGAALPLVLLSSLYVKNAVLFGSPSTSSWMGMSLAKLTISYLPAEGRERLLHAGEISPASLVEPFSPASAYPTSYFSPGAFRRIPALTDTTKSTGSTNLNHIGYVRLSRQYLKDALTVVRDDPETWLAATRDAWRIYAWSTSNYRLLEPNRSRIAVWNGFFDRAIYLYVPALRVYLGLVVVLVASVVFAGVALLPSSQATASRAMLAFILFTIAYTALVGNSLEMGENNRFRFMTDPYTVALVALLVQRLIERVQRLSGHRERGVTGVRRQGVGAGD